MFQAAAGNVPRDLLVRARDYSEEEWSTVTARLADRGLVTLDGGLTREGRSLKQDIEDRTEATTTTSTTSTTSTTTTEATTTSTQPTTTTVATTTAPP